MIRRLLVPLVGSGLLLAATAGSALAKCEGPEPPAFCSKVIATFSGAGGAALRLTAGAPTPVSVMITQAEEPLAADSVTLVFTRIGEGTVVTAAATRASGGTWQATVTLPADGGWTVAAQVGVDGFVESRGFEVLSVSPAPKAFEPPVTAPTTPAPISPTPTILPFALLLAGLAAGGLVVAVGLRSRGRRRAPAG